jgi:hypothetical protein
MGSHTSVCAPAVPASVGVAKRYRPLRSATERTDQAPVRSSIISMLPMPPYVLATHRAAKQHVRRYALPIAQRRRGRGRAFFQTS